MCFNLGKCKRNAVYYDRFFLVLKIMKNNIYISLLNKRNAGVS